MISIQPRTYNEVLRLQKCYTLASHYTDVTESEFDQMYRFLNQSDENAVIGNRHVVSLVDQNKKIIRAFSATASDDSFDRIEITNKDFVIYPHVVSSGSDTGGSSTNNNNNNNNNNNS